MEHNDALQAFLKAWQNEDFKKMFRFSQKTWKEGKSEKHIEALFSPNKMKGFNVFSYAYVSGVAMKYNVDITLANGTRIMSVINVICEIAPGKPAPYGEWGVNPASVQNIVSKVSPKEGKAAPASNKKPWKKPEVKKATQEQIKKAKLNADK